MSKPRVKISELIKTLQEIMGQNGDLEVINEGVEPWVHLEEDETGKFVGLG